MIDNAQKMQAILYAHGGEMKKSELAPMLKISVEEIANIANSLSELLEGSGLELLETNTSLSLRTANAHTYLINDLQKREEEKDIGTAGLEVLAIIMYKGSASRAVIDYIRGVNSSGTLRTLVLRGLLERTRDANDARAWVYTATPELFAHLGITSADDLPEHEELANALNEQEDTDENNE